MSRLFLASSLILAALTTTAVADRSEPAFAQPPPGARAPSDDPSAGAPRPTHRPIDREAVRAKLVEARTANLARFHAYRRAGVYPSNVASPELANIWRDAAGHYCAAATIIRASGNERLVAQVAEQTNGIRIADVEQGPLMDWILTSGFTQDEVALIQRPFRPVVRDLGPSPARPPRVDPALRAAETQRLAKLYAEIEATLVANQQASLDRALDRLMASPALAVAFAGR